MSAPRIAVSGLHRGENPQPGAGIVRSIRRKFPDAFIVGLVYDALESGIYAEGGPDVVQAMPYPSNGAEAFFRRLDEVREKSPFEFFIPTLDAEIELLVHLEDEIAARGLRTCLPGKKMLQRRAKNHLAALAEKCGIEVPDTAPAYDIAGALAAAKELGYPLMVKGQYYDAKKVASDAELSGAMWKLLAEWGAPAILQRCVCGPEFNALGLGDGEGGIIGLCCIRKTILSDKGKGLGGITIADKRLDDLCARLVRELRWRGPFEIEVMLDESDGEYALIEMNPRFPAWVDFPSMIGVNFPATLVEMMTPGRRPALLPRCAAGNFYLRHQTEVVGNIEQLAALSTSADFPARDAAVHAT
jgi:carbamoyl-phosphate synthase large subunit